MEHLRQKSHLQQAQHQAHHRGQTHNMVSISGVKPPSLGYIDFRMEMDRSLITTPDEN